MDDADAPQAPREVPADEAPRERPTAWPSPPPQTVEHAVALLAAGWTRARGAA